MAVWFGLCLGFIFNKLFLRSFGGLGPGLEPGKRINYTPFSYSLSLPSLGYFLLLSSLSLPSFLFLPLPFFSFSSFFSFLSPLLAFPLYCLLPSIFLACHLSLDFCFSVAICFSVSSLPASCTPSPWVCTPQSLLPAWPSICPPPIPHFPGVGSGRGKAKERQGICTQAFSRGPSRGS